MKTIELKCLLDLYEVLGKLPCDYDLKLAAFNRTECTNRVTVAVGIDAEKREVVFYPDVTLAQITIEQARQCERLELEIARLKEALNKEKDALDEKNAEIERAWKQYTEMYKTAHGESDRLKHENKVLQITLDALKKETKEEVDVLQKSRSYWRDEYRLLKKSIDGE